MGVRTAATTGISGCAPLKPSSHVTAAARRRRALRSAGLPGCGETMAPVFPRQAEVARICPR